MSETDFETEVQSENKDKLKTSFYIILESTFIKDITDSFDIKLTSDLKEIFWELLNIYPDFFNEIEQDINSLIQDEKIIIQDIVKFNEIIKKIFNTIYSVKNSKITTSNCANNTSIFFKYIVNLMLVNNRIPIEMNDENKQTIIKNIYSAIDSSIELLTYSKTIKPKKLFKLFSI